jgi:hypothetical protein
MDDTRSALLADDFDERTVVEHKGHRVEVRPPTLAQQRQFTRVAKDKHTKETDGARMLVLAVIGCTYDPATGARVFKPEDEDALLNKTTDPRGIVGKIARVLQKVMSEKPEEIEENFDGAPTGS